MFELLTSKNFSSLNIVQFLGAFNDNILRQVFLLFTVGAGVYDLQATATVIFAIPYLLFSAPAGQIADSFSKRQVIVYSRYAELAVMILATMAIYRHSFSLLLLSLFLMSLQSTFFSPAKYGILPEILSYKKLSAGNGVIQMFTYAAILVGTATAGFLLQILERHYWVVGIFLVVSSSTSIAVSFFIDKIPAADPGQQISFNFLRRLASSLGWIRRDIYLLLTMCACAFGWLVGTVLTINLNVYGMVTLGLDEGWTSLFMVILGAGIGVGCLLAGYLSGGRIEAGLVPFGAIGMGSSLLMLYTVPANYWTNVFYLLATGVFSGFFFIPLLATLQGRPPAEKKGETLGTTNFFTFSGVAVASAGYVLMVGPGQFSAPAIMGLLGLTSLIVGIIAAFAIPGYLLRFVFRAIFNIVYRIRCEGLENVPEASGALFVSNHVSYLDGFFISACFDRPVRFLAHQMFFEIPLVGWFLRLMKIIPIYPPSPGKVKNALNTVRCALANGEYVCVFPEGAITRTGQILGINRGPEALARNSDIPVIPVYLENVWGSIFSFERGKFFWKLPRNIFDPVKIHFGRPLDGEPRPETIRVALQSMEADILKEKTSNLNPRRQLLKKLRIRPRAKIVRDLINGREYSGLALLLKTLALASRLRKRDVGRNGPVGVVNSCGCTSLLINLALFFNSATVWNIDGEQGREKIENILQSNSIETVLVGPVYTDKVSSHCVKNKIVIDEMIENITAADYLGSSVKIICPSLLKETDFTSPAACFVSESGILEYGIDSCISSVRGLEKVFSRYPRAGINARDCFSTPGGYLSRFLWPLWSGRSLLFAGIDQKVEENCIIPVLYNSAPAFSKKQSENSAGKYLRVIVVFSRPGEITGGVLKPEENYFFLSGWSEELTPGFLSLNVPALKAGAGDANQTGTKTASLGRALPGLAVKVVGDDGADLQNNNTPGKLLFYGPALGRPGWQDTGYTGKIDSDGFVYLKQQS
ncbi:MAG: MFS transporter [bacterium]